MQNAHNPVGNILTGSWRAEPDPLSVSEASLSASVEVLTSTGAGGLAWRRIARNAPLRASRPAGQLRSCAQMQVLDAARDDLALGDLARLFHANDINPLLFKGWAVAQHYSERHLRPMGDADLCAPPGRFDELADLLRRHGFSQYAALADADRGRVLCFASPSGSPGNDLSIDLHDRLDRFLLPPLEEVFARALPLRAGDHSILAPAAEDHLRLVAIHFLLHGGWRPLWLCDVSAMLETLPSTFDWDLCLGAVPRRRRWVACTLQLAHELLGARLENVPERYRARRMPGWFGATVLREWEKPFSEHHARPLLSYAWRHRRHQFVGEILARWPNAIRSTVELDAGFTKLPRWPYRLAHFARSIGRGVVQGLRSRLQ